MQRAEAEPRPPDVIEREVATAKSEVVRGPFLARVSAVATTTACSLLLLTSCGTGPRDVMASAACHPDGAPQSALPVTVTVDDGTGSSGTRAAETCQVLTLAVALTADEQSTPHGTVQPGRFQVVTEQGTGSLRLVDQPTCIREADDGSGVQDYGSLTGWYALVEDPAPGEYRVSRSIRWEPVPPPADTTRALDRTPEPPVTGVLDLVVTVG